MPDAERVMVDVADSPLAPRLTLALRVEDALAPGRAPESPSHALVFRSDAGAVEATFSAEGGVPLDRDVVVRWPVAVPDVGVALETFRAASGPLAGGAFGLLSVVPPAPDSRPARFPRDLVVLLDTSGSMAGDPLDQARRVVSALADTLGDEDSLELVEFSNAPRRWNPSPVRATASARRDALAWLSELRASGSTEMRDALVEALGGIRPDAQRQILLVTDGLIGFEQEIVAEISRRLPAASRLHALGVGESVNRSLLAPAARAGRGTESVVGIGEDPERAVRTLVARMDAPLVTELAIAGDALVEHAPARLPDLFAGAPALVSLRLRPEGGTLRVSGKVPDGSFDRTVSVAPVAASSGSPAVAALFGREAVEDLETRLAAGEGSRDVERAIERLGLDHQISTRLTSWVAVSEEPAVDPTKPTRRIRVPQELPHGMSIEGLGLRSARPAAAVMAAPASYDVLFQSEAPRVKARSAPPRARSVGVELAGQIVLEREGEIVIEVVLDRDLAWLPSPAVSLLFTDGSRLVGVVDLGRTTGRGSLATGQTIRLVVRHKSKAGPASKLASVGLRGGDGAVTIRIAPIHGR